MLKNEYLALQALRQHVEFIKVFEYGTIEVGGSSHEYLLLEFAEGGELFDFVQKKASDVLKSEPGQLFVSL